MFCMPFKMIHNNKMHTWLEPDLRQKWVLPPHSPTSPTLQNQLSLHNRPQHHLYPSKGQYHRPRPQPCTPWTFYTPTGQIDSTNPFLQVFFPRHPLYSTTPPHIHPSIHPSIPSEVNAATWNQNIGTVSEITSKHFFSESQWLYQLINERDTEQGSA